MVILLGKRLLPENIHKIDTQNKNTRMTKYMTNGNKHDKILFWVVVIAIVLLSISLLRKLIS